MPTPNQGPYPRFQFMYIKRFGQVIVRTHIQSMHSILHIIMGGQNQHRHIIFSMAQTAKNISPIHIR